MKLPDRRAFFAGMNRVTSLALGGAMLLALSLLADVYGQPGTAAEAISLALAGGGAVLAVGAIVLGRSRRGP